MKIDFTKPIRTKRSKLRLYPLSFGHFVILGTIKDSHWKSGNEYRKDGTPTDEDCPWGPVENFEESPFEYVVDVHEERERERFEAHVLEELGDNELFGLF